MAHTEQRHFLLTQKHTPSMRTRCCSVMCAQCNAALRVAGSYGYILGGVANMCFAGGLLCTPLIWYYVGFSVPLSTKLHFTTKASFIMCMVLALSGGGE